MQIRKHLVTSFFGLIVAVLLVPAAMAQDAPAEATPGGPSEGYPVAIHEGTCASPTAEPAWTMDNALSVGVDEKDPEVIGSEQTRVITESSKKLDVKLDDLSKTQHVVAVHASPDDYGTIVACGEIAGILKDGKLVIALVPVDDSGVFGVAILDRDDKKFLDLGKDQTQVTVYVVAPDNEAEAVSIS